MYVELAKHILDQLKQLRFNDSLITSLMREPLLHPNFKDILAYSISVGIRANVITNFLFIPERVSHEELLTIGIDTLVLSYQTPNESTFSHRKANISFEKYFNKLRDILTFLRDNPIKTRRVEIHLLQSLYNYINIEVANDYLLIESAILKLFEILHHNSAAGYRKCLGKMIAKYARKFRRGKQYLDSFETEIGAGVYVVLKRANTWVNRLIPEDCRVFSQRNGNRGFFNSALGVLWDGRCTVCCQDFDCQIHVGDAKLNTIEEILEEDPFAELREMEKKGLLVNKFCQTCK